MILDLRRYQAGEVDLLHAAQRDRGCPTLHVGRSIHNRVQARLRGDWHPLGLQSLDIRTAFQRRYDDLANIDCVAGGLVVFEKRKRRASVR